MRKHHRSASPYEKSFGFARALRVGDRIEVAGTAPIAPDGTCFEGDAYAQARRCFEIIVEAIEALGGEARHVVRTRMFLVDPADQDAVGRAHGEFFRGIDPAATMLVAGGLLDERWRVEIEAVAVVSD